MGEAERQLVAVCRLFDDADVNGGFVLKGGRIIEEPAGFGIGQQAVVGGGDDPLVLNLLAGVSIYLRNADIAGAVYLYNGALHRLGGIVNIEAGNGAVAVYIFGGRAVIIQAAQMNGGVFRLHNGGFRYGWDCGCVRSTARSEDSSSECRLSPTRSVKRSQIRR